MFMDLDFVLVHKHTKKELGQYPAILTSGLVNNLHVHMDTHLLTRVFSIEIPVPVRKTGCGDDYHGEDMMVHII